MDNSKMIQESVQQGLGALFQDGALVVETGAFTGRAAKMRYIVRNPSVESEVNWGPVNQAVPQDFAEAFFPALKKKIQGSKHYDMSGFVGPYSVEVHSLSPWHIAFAQNMFRDSRVESLAKDIQTPHQIKIWHDPHGKISDLGVIAPSETAIILDFENAQVGIVGTAYAGEIKKSAFTMCNYYLPQENVFPMHSSANCLDDGSSSCVLFGLSGTGKTTLSAAADRWLIGDDEIAWSPSGISNLEGGCYAKLIDLDPNKEPEIYQAVLKKGAILENVGFNGEAVDFADRSKTENTRGSYSLGALEKTYRQDAQAEPPRSIVFLTADAFGALPAVAKLDEFQAQYHFISGYTAKVAGTELGVTEPQAAFSACFGAPFMPRHPAVYAKLLVESMKRTGASVWLLNTGWTHGGYGKGDRFPIKVSRALLRAIQSGSLDKAPMKSHPVFGFQVPTEVEGVDPAFLDIPQGGPVYELAKKFQTNMLRFRDKVETKVVMSGGPQIPQ